MGVHLHSMAVKAKQMLKLQSLVTRSQLSSVPKGHLAAFVGEIEKKRFVALPKILLFVATSSFQESVMGVHLPSMALKAKQVFKLHSFVSRHQLSSVPKGHFAVYVGETEKKRFVVPVSYLNHPSFISRFTQLSGGRVRI
ncbi:hypothetical protein Syun_009921 [Stephania yunnanensis]|uniref:Uncharacterized protein n=1 Tax=Stephania yunnanensis TaxID=152371 RepID=A0AAP0PPH6_9MAGN